MDTFAFISMLYTLTVLAGLVVSFDWNCQKYQYFSALRRYKPIILVILRTLKQGLTFSSLIL